MAWLRSAPVEGTPWRHTVIAALGAVLIPSMVGGAATGVMRLSGWAGGSTTPGMLMLLSPLVSVPGMILVVPVAAVLLREGRFGWISVVVLGLCMGGLIAVMAQYPAAIPFGAGVLIIMRALLGRLMRLD